jgi:ketosteroid isomerase-like protein
MIGTRTTKPSEGSHCLASTKAISPEAIRSQVKVFWHFFSTKSAREFRYMYAPDATIFAANSPRCETARLMLIRRIRELFAPGSSVTAQLGPISVQILGSAVAIASYPFHYAVTRLLANGRRYHLDVPFGRVTQIFARDKEGVLRIVHEHMSSAQAVSSNELPEHQVINM